VRVADCEVGGLLASRVYIDLVGVSEPEALDRLLRGVLETQRRPDRSPEFPGGSGGRAANLASVTKPKFPGPTPDVRRSGSARWSGTTVGKVKFDAWTVLLRLSDSEHVIEYRFGAIDRILLNGSEGWTSLLPRRTHLETLIKDGSAKRKLTVERNYRGTSVQILVDDESVINFRAK